MVRSFNIPASNIAYIRFDMTEDLFWLDKKHRKLNAATVAGVFREIANEIDGIYDEPYSGGELSGSCDLDGITPYGIAHWKINIDR